MSQSTVNSLLEKMRSSGFSHGTVRVGGVQLDFARAAPRPPLDPPAAVALEPVPEVVVRAVAPGTVHLDVQRGTTVEQGAPLGHLQVHRTTVRLVAPAGGSVVEIHAADGSFAAYGDAVCSIRSDS